ncbi:acyltransferase domain-containing protein, partial [Streptomyces sp. NPDC048331]|uniref:acyltransferase domain-containing protein n=1 Tax=Streptomyces sp. NPDC048331 TaxID=3365534 RepID=UPI0037188758
MLSARTPEALRAQADRLLTWSRNHPDHDPTHTAHALTRRTHFDHRAGITATTTEQRHQALTALTNATRHPNLTTNTPTTGKLAFVLPGQGAQHTGMGHHLHTTYPAFADTFDTIATHLDPHLTHPLTDIVFNPDHHHTLNQTQNTQAALFAFQTALHHLYKTHGITPDYLIGHSIGEVTAAHLAGILTLEDACTLVAARGRLMQAQPTGGAMLALQATETELHPHLTHHEQHISIAAVNGPHSLVIAGDDHHIETIAHHFEDQGRKTKWLNVSHAFHSPHMDGMLQEFEQIASTLTYHTPHTPLISNLTGQLADHTIRTPQYWTRHVRDTVRYADGITTLHNLGTTHYLELGPDTTATAMTRNNLPDNHPTPLHTTPTLRKNTPETHSLTTTLTTLHTLGTTPTWTTPTPTHHTNLPTYPFQHQHYWL